MLDPASASRYTVGMAVAIKISGQLANTWRMKSG
jgi:hypothetical protein